VAKQPAAVTQVEFFYEVEQRSPEWYELRRGVPTASNFGAILAGAKGRQTLLRRLAGEIITGEIGETYRNDAMDRGIEMEKDAREWYERARFVDLKQCGFVRRTLPSGRFAGASPDSFIGEDGALEVKTTRPDLWIELFETGTAPTEHKAQLHGNLWITGRRWIDLVVFYRGMPRGLTYRFNRDEAYIKEISNAVEVFDFDLHKLVAKVKAI
jgi:hypothetical protein